MTVSASVMAPVCAWETRLKGNGYREKMPPDVNKEISPMIAVLVLPIHAHMGSECGPCRVNKKGDRLLQVLQIIEEQLALVQC